VRFGHRRNAALAAAVDQTSAASFRLPLAAVIDHCDLGKYAPLFQGLKELYDRAGRDSAEGTGVEDFRGGAAAAGADDFRSDALLRQILADLLADLGRPRVRRLARAVALMEDMPETRPSLGELSALCGLSEKHFSRLFKEAYGAPPSRYARRQRIERARLLLEETSLSVDAVAAELGYPDRFTFSKQFKSVLGFSPGACRR
jgi:AraC-like DNA-binding protein